MGDLTWIYYGISLGEVEEIFVGDNKDKSGYQLDNRREIYIGDVMGYLMDMLVG